MHACWFQRLDPVDLYKYVSTETAVVDREVLKGYPLVVDPTCRGVEAQFQPLKMFQLLKACHYRQQKGWGYGAAAPPNFKGTLYLLP